MQLFLSKLEYQYVDRRYINEQFNLPSNIRGHRLRLLDNYAMYRHCIHQSHAFLIAIIYVMYNAYIIHGQGGQELQLSKQGLLLGLIRIMAWILEYL